MPPDLFWATIAASPVVFLLKVVVVIADMFFLCILGPSWYDFTEKHPETGDMAWGGFDKTLEVRIRAEVCVRISAHMQ